jgi:beta-glucosidase
MAVTFPKGFVWGAATSSYQIEGASAEDGRGESIWDRFTRTPSNIRDGSNGDVACDHYHRWGQDIALMKSLGIAAYRFSVAWPRILPAGRGAVNAKGLAYYSRLVDGLLEAGITPYVTLYHWDLPQVFQDEGGGWVNRATAEAFVEYADIVSRHLGDRVKHWITHNEPWCASLVGYQKGLHAPGLRDWPAALAASHHLLLSHGWAVPVVRANCPGGELGITVNLSPYHPASSSPEDGAAARHFDGQMNRWFLDPLYRAQYPADMVADYVELGSLPPGGLTFVRPDDMRAIAVPTDFLGVNYYNRGIIRSDRIPESQNRPRSIAVPAEKDCTSIGWEVYPHGLFEVLLRVHLDYRVPKILVTENGAAYGHAPDASQRVSDGPRIDFLRAHLGAMQQAIGVGVPVEGYFAWSLMDNFEWDHGYSQRFGVVWVDYATQARIVKDSGHWYRRVIEENSLPGEPGKGGS